MERIDMASSDRLPPLNGAHLVEVNLNRSGKVSLVFYQNLDMVPAAGKHFDIFEINFYRWRCARLKLHLGHELPQIRSWSLPAPKHRYRSTPPVGADPSGSISPAQQYHLAFSDGDLSIVARQVDFPVMVVGNIV
jgi:hypothetical protein